MKMISIKKYTELDYETKSTLAQIIEEEFGHIPIVKETEWAKPDWTIVYYEDQQIATFYNIVEREIIMDNVKVKIAGINNVITPKAFRGKGYATKVLRETESLLFNDLQSAFGVLLCADALLPFYERLGWYQIDCPVYFNQSTGEQLWMANTMLLAPGKNVFPKVINLNGLPW